MKYETLLLLLAGSMPSGLVLAQSPEEGFELQRQAFEKQLLVQQQADQQRLVQELEAEEQRLQMDRERRAVDAQRKEVEVARAEMQRARAELEAAARRVADVSAANSAQYASVLRSMNSFPFRQRALLGVNPQDSDTGVRVIGVTPGGPSADAGIQTGDIIASVDGELLVGGDASPTENLLVVLEDIEPGSTVPVVVIRDGEEQTLEIVAGDRGDVPGRVSVLPGTGFNVRNFTTPRGRVGQVLTTGDGNVNFNWTGDGLVFTRFGNAWREMELVTLTDGLGEYFGTAEGLLVVRAPESDELGLMDGDVILEIGGRTPSSPEHAMRILRSFEPGETLELEIMRQQRRRELEYELPTPERTPGDAAL
jgi:C-terminal processing protease CtpA/Prc